MHRLLTTAVLLFSCLPTAVFSMNTDSLYAVLDTVVGDSMKIEQCLEWGDLFGSLEEEEGDFWFQEALDRSEKTGISDLTAQVYCQWADNKLLFGNLETSIEYISEAKKIVTEKSNYKVRNQLMNAEAAYHDEMQNNEQAIQIRLKQIELARQYNDSNSLAAAYHNIGITFYHFEEYEKTDSIINLSREINERTGNLKFLNSNYSMLANVNHALKNYDKALAYNARVLVYYDSIGYTQGKTMITMNIGIVNKDKGNTEAIEYLNKAAALAEKHGYLRWKVFSYRKLTVIYERQGKYKLALDCYDKSVQAKDSLLNEKNINALAALQKEIDDKKIGLLEKDNLLKEQQNAERDLIIEKTNLQLYFSLGMGGLFLVLGIFILRGYQNKRKSNREILAKNEKIEEQRIHLQEQNNDILDSINYAKRLQTAMLPPTKLFEQQLPESFVLYKPKDIVAGDFYWLEPTPQGVCFAAADCTGHGVPGAMVSVVCNTALNRSVREYGLTNPAEILDKTREIVIGEFERSEDEVKDGMDIALCRLESFSDEGATLQYAGAHNPLWIVRNGELLETKANKQPIGKFDVSQPFTSHDIQVQKGDAIYVFSDGFSDQFGSDTEASAQQGGKKYKSGRFKKFLVSISSKPMGEQHRLIEQEFMRWKGDLEQLDDVCVIGVRV